MKLRLVKLSEEYKEQLFEMMDEWTNSGESIVPYTIRKNDYHDFENYLAKLETKERFVRFLEGIGWHCTEAKVWTTDGFYRETEKKVARRTEMGCVAVDMECASVAAVAQFRNKQVLQFFYAADVVGKEEWDTRSLGNHEALGEKDKIAWLALEFAKVM